ncbi:hypothetical protein JHK84_043780 [Glycine max]|uniref:Uncharacterized protein n=1 Tax=Glycine soja TaxID=3848 RepID=A0A0B2RBU5_GLYSO|nr:hypothetical protein JHK86_043965 [Glycine max]KAG4976577.1 hypothetical protein JHK86_036051 [Glycine max]KAG5117667.1 hypothetical protein JHK84_043780 [Glycine max]KHN29849.1 hypothetical protein glysoja_034093 [Glycine soja]
MNKLELHHVLFTSSTYIINCFPVPKTISSSGTEQTMSSQEHVHFYILEKMADVRIHS